MKYLVIGGNASGMSFASRKHRLDKDAVITVLEKNDYVSFGACGIPYYVGREFDEVDEFFARTPEQIIESGIDLRINSVVSHMDTNNKVVTYTNNEKEYNIEYDVLVVASGAQPKLIEYTGVGDNIHTVTNFHDAVVLREKFNKDSVKKIGIVGAGFIGMEMMDNAYNIGKEVTVFNNLECIMSGTFSSEMLVDVQQQVSDTVELVLNSNITEIVGKPDGVEVVNDNKKYEFDVLIVAVGFVPNSEFINVDKLSNGAILVDANGKTSVDNVYAVGDCATVHNSITKKQQYRPLATTANKAGKNLADKLSNSETAFSGMLGSTCIKILDYEIASTGLSEAEAKALYENAVVKVVHDKNHTGYCKGQEKLSVKIVYDSKSYQIYGAELVGKDGAVQRCNVIAALIQTGGTTKQLGYIDFCYAPPFSRTWDILNVVGNVIK